MIKLLRIGARHTKGAVRDAGEALTSASKGDVCNAVDAGIGVVANTFVSAGAVALQPVAWVGQVGRGSPIAISLAFIMIVLNANGYTAPTNSSNRAERRDVLAAHQAKCLSAFAENSADITAALSKPSSENVVIDTPDFTFRDQKYLMENLGYKGGFDASEYASKLTCVFTSADNGEHSKAFVSTKVDGDKVIASSVHRFHVYGLEKS